jgi:hypothetical protein
VGDSQDGLLADTRRESGAVEQVSAEAQERTSQLGVTHQGRHEVAGALGVAPLWGQHPGQGLLDSLVPLVGGQRLQAHPQSPLGFHPVTLAERESYSHLQLTDWHDSHGWSIPTVDPSSRWSRDGLWRTCRNNRWMLILTSREDSFQLVI